MSIVLLLVLFSTLLILGFGWGAWTLAAIVLLLAAGLSALMVRVDVEGTKSDWGERRCNPDVLLTAFLYKPSDDPRSAREFATENFQFCVGKVFEESLKIFMTPLTSLISTEIDTANTMMAMFNVLRTLKAQAMANFLKILNPVYERYKLTAMQYAVNFQRIKAAFDRISSFAFAIAYMGFSTQTALLNIVDFVVMILLIFIGILAAMLILIWFPLLPVLWLVLAVIASVAGAGYATGGLGGAFCFDPNTRVSMQDGSVKTLRECKLGDVLMGGAMIDGILETDATNETIYSIDGILVSGSHLMWSDTHGAWKPVSECENAVPVLNQLSTLLCLRTSTREIPLRGHSGKQWRFKDWEELPESIPQSDAFWDYLVSHMLNKEAPSWKDTPKEDPLLGAKCQVRLRTGEKVELSRVSIGDEIYSKDGFTKVLGIYKGRGALSHEKAMSDGVWTLPISSVQWKHPSVSSTPTTIQIGHHIITESGSFWVETDSFSGFVRDFTEVGCENLFLTYGFTQALLERATRIKKSLSREESCVQDFLSLVSLSC